VSAADPGSPLHGHLVPSQHPAPGVTLAERRAALTEIAARRGQAAALGLPPTGGSVARWGGVVLGLAPGVGLLVGGAPPALPRQVAAVIDQSGGFVVLRCAGPAAAEALAGICRLDLHDTAFPAGRAARSLMAQLPVVLHRAGEAAFDLIVPASYAVSFAETLLHLATPHGCAVLPPVIDPSRDHP